MMTEEQQALRSLQTKMERVMDLMRSRPMSEEEAHRINEEYMIPLENTIAQLEKLYEDERND
jgi:hypothetical protein